MGKQTAKRRYRNCSGPAIKRLRQERGWTQDQLAAKLQTTGLDLTRFDVSRLENGWRSLFDFELFLLAHLFGTSPDSFSPALKKLEKDLPALRQGYLD